MGKCDRDSKIEETENCKVDKIVVEDEDSISQMVQWLKKIRAETKCKTVNKV